MTEEELNEDKRQNDEGFTLVEMLAVLTIMLLLMGMAWVATGSIRERGLETRVKGDLRSISLALETYNSDLFDYPDEEYGIDALVQLPQGLDLGDRYKGPYLATRPVDPWGNPYIYIYPGDENAYDLLSYGADGEPGGEGPDADISYWDAGEE